MKRIASGARASTARLAALALLILLPVPEPAAGQARRPASGTAWDPASETHSAFHVRRGAWSLELHGQAMLYRTDQGGARGDEQWGSTNWLMGTAMRPLAGGALGLRGMFSLEPLTVGGCGTPNILQTGELCDGEPIVDAQHPHDLFVELAASYGRPLGRGLEADLYLAAVGEPALGPVAFPHRGSARSNPVSPITHHWLDSSHIAFGVVTAGIYGRRWRAEASVFNGREPDDERLDFDFAPLHSVAARVQVAPTDGLVLQASRGRLRNAHRHVTLLPPELLCPAGGGCHLLDRPDDLLDVVRTTASVSYRHSLARGRAWAVTAGWGWNEEQAHLDTDGALVEGRVDLPGGNVVFGRAERAEKSDHDLGIQPTLSQFLAGEQRSFDLVKVVVGYGRAVAAAAGLGATLGIAVDWSHIPRGLEDRYGDRTPVGATLFFSIRPEPIAPQGGEEQ